MDSPPAITDHATPDLLETVEGYVSQVQEYLTNYVASNLNVEPLKCIEKIQSALIEPLPVNLVDIFALTNEIQEYFSTIIRVLGTTADLEKLNDPELMEVRANAKIALQKLNAIKLEVFDSSRILPIIES